MQRPLRVGILGAGLGSRLKTSAGAKPLAPLAGGTLLSRLVHAMRANGAEEIHCALRDELVPEPRRTGLPRDARYHFVNTESSLHTLAVLAKAMAPARPALFTMADTVLRAADLQAFLGFCDSLPPDACALLVTPFVDDEKPLWVEVDGDGWVSAIGAASGRYVTSGMYFLSAQAQEEACREVERRTQKMRNFLRALAEKRIPIKAFVVEKTIDVDHPSDLQKAADFLRGD